MSTEAFENFYFDVCNLDYPRLARALRPLVERMDGGPRGPHHRPRDRPAVLDRGDPGRPLRGRDEHPRRRGLHRAGPRLGRGARPVQHADDLPGDLVRRRPARVPGRPDRRGRLHRGRRQEAPPDPRDRRGRVVHRRVVDRLQPADPPPDARHPLRREDRRQLPPHPRATPTTRPTTATARRSTGTSSRSSAPTTAAAPSPSTASRSGSMGGSSPRSCRRSTRNDRNHLEDETGDGDPSTKTAEIEGNRTMPTMPTALILALALLAQPQPPPDPDQFPLAVHRSMEIDDLDREIQRLHDTVLLKRASARPDPAPGAAGLVSRSDLEREPAVAPLRRGPRGRIAGLPCPEGLRARRPGHASCPPTSPRRTTSCSTGSRSRRRMAQVDIDYRGFTLKQTRALYQRKAVSAARNSTMPSWPTTRPWPASR